MSFQCAVLTSEGVDSNSPSTGACLQLWSRTACPTSPWSRQPSSETGGPGRTAPSPEPGKRLGEEEGEEERFIFSPCLCIQVTNEDSHWLRCNPNTLSTDARYMSLFVVRNQLDSGYKKCTTTLRSESHSRNPARCERQR